MSPPKNWFCGFITETVVAVPISIITSGAPYSFIPAAASAIRSLPSCDGLSVIISIPVILSELTVIGSSLKISETASFKISVRRGTTEEIIAPSILLSEILWLLRRVFISSL